MKEKIRFSDLVEHISSQAGVPKQFAHDYLKELSAVIEDGLLRDGSVSIYGFGNFKLQWVPPRQGHNPQTGAAMAISGRHKVTFRPHKRLRDYINRRYRKLSVEVLDETPTGKAPGLHHELPPLDSPADPLPRASAAASIAATHTIAERIKPTRRPTALRERANPAAGALGGLTHGQAESGVAREPAARRPKALWMGVAAGVLVLLVAVLAMLYPGSAPTPPATGQAPAAGVSVDSTSNAPAAGRPAVWTAQQQAPAAERPSAPMVQAAAVTPSDAAAPNAVASPAPPATDTAPAGTPGGVHQVQRGDSFWAISSDRYRDPFLWPNIFRANLTRVRNPDVLQSGIQVTVPALQGNAQQLTAQDNRDVATGYLHAYKAYKRRGNLKAAYYLWVAELRDPLVVQENVAGIDAKDLAFVRTLNK